MPLKYPKRTSIWWHDHCFTDGGDVDPSTPPTGKLLLTVGQIINETPQIVNVGLEWDPDGGKFRQTQEIIKKNIIDREDWQISHKPIPKIKLEKIKKIS